MQWKFQTWLGIRFVPESNDLATGLFLIGLLINKTDHSDRANLYNVHSFVSVENETLGLYLKQKSTEREKKIACQGLRELTKNLRDNYSVSIVSLLVLPSCFDLL